GSGLGWCHAQTEHRELGRHRDAGHRGGRRDARTARPRRSHDPRVLWIALLVVYVVSVLVTGAYAFRPQGLAALAIAVAVSWVLVLTVPGMGLLIILVVVTAALSTYVVPLAVSMVIVLLNTGVVL